MILRAPFLSHAMMDKALSAVFSTSEYSYWVSWKERIYVLLLLNAQWVSGSIVRIRNDAQGTGQLLERVQARIRTVGEISRGLVLGQRTLQYDELIRMTVQVTLLGRTRENQLSVAQGFESESLWVYIVQQA